MSNLFKNRSFIFIVAIINILISFSLMFMFAKNTSFSPLTIFAHVILIMAFIALLVFFNNSHKELLKIMLTVILVSSIFRCAIDFVSYSYNFSTISSFFTASEINRFSSATKYLPFMIFSIIINMGFIIINFIIFINHCIINFTNKPSSYAIIFNQILILVYLIFYIGLKIFTILFGNTEINLFIFLLDLDGFFAALLVVCVETFINVKRDEKINSNN